MASKDSIVYFIDILRQHAEEALDILSDTICNPMISEGELEEVKSIIHHQNVMSSADALSREAAMMAAYAGSSLGNSHICPEGRLELVDRTILQEFRSKYFFAENCIISGVGIDHEYMVELVRKKFSTLPGRISSNPIASTKRAKSTFSGSLVKNERKLQEPFVKVAICFEAGDGWSDPSLVALCVLQTLLGGGKSFSAGGPGKGAIIVHTTTTTTTTSTTTVYMSLL
jgi:processing peptidase subunit alpha